MRSILVSNPATHEQIGEVPVLSDAEVKAAVHTARAAQPAWAKLSFKERGKLILNARDLILNNIDEIASLISNENGKPIIEAISHDIMPVMDLMTYFATSSKKLLQKESVKLGKWGVLGRKSEIEYDPHGVVGIIAPWNFPFSIPIGGIVMALMVGNTVVLKPSEFTPLIGLKIGQIFKDAQIPSGALQIITGDGMTGAALVRSGVDKILFTGSVATGKKIMAEAAATLTPVTLELGGKDPFIVLPDADLDLASSAAVWGGFCNSGQVCASVERVYVHESVAEPFTRMMVEKTAKLRQGVGTGEVDLGAMTVPMQVNKVEVQVEEAKKRGANVLIGGGRKEGLKGNFYLPTLITGVNHDFSVVRDETFGPVIPVMTYRTEDEVVALANDSLYALNAYIFTKDLAKGRKLASRIVAGTVNVNESVFTHALPQTPWGGPKESGIGHTHGAMGLLDLVRMRHVHVSRFTSKKNNFWWYGYSADKTEMMKALCFGLFGSGAKRVKGFLKFLRLSTKVKTM